MNRKIASWTHLQSMVVEAFQLLDQASKEIYHLMSEPGDDPFNVGRYGDGPFNVGCYSKIVKFLNENNGDHS